MSAPWGSFDPNSAHQLWSRWVTQIHTHDLAHAAPQHISLVRDNTARFYRKLFGSVAEAKIDVSINTERQGGDPRLAVSYVCQVRCEGVPAHDASYQKWMCDVLETFFINGFGPSAQITTEVFVEAGDVQDGKPPAQLLVLPSRIEPKNKLFG